jgi:hypothetical protein
VKTIDHINLSPVAFGETKSVPAKLQRHDMNPFPHHPFDPSGEEKFRQQVEERFLKAMSGIWNPVYEGLLRLKPADWKGFRFDVDVQWHKTTGQFHFSARFRDGASNRSKGINSTHLLELIGALHEAYRSFDERLEWKHASFELKWDKTKKQWIRETARTYGRTVLNASQGDPENIGLS